ncbi:unnamed protein product [Vitrella brassicaformis CCMP3155]|uniref:Methyltransferase type 11 domain-containing protein n=1 Tax=Vitrella brassicaformis (strain CCMP3155) TaxID=1169540 RepID=A0A0G4GHV3_VITBC|nr:unnamed protein product [Vitrella brassicaformis CCMP3155]|eukprot:CEM29181.1 unnamed protein product [Vitrella brassicaformis CCMP3155]
MVILSDVICLLIFPLAHAAPCFLPPLRPRAHLLSRSRVRSALCGHSSTVAPLVTSSRRAAIAVAFGAAAEALWVASNLKTIQQDNDVLKQELFSAIRPSSGVRDILEIGFGRNANQDFYTEIAERTGGLRVTGLDKRRVSLREADTMKRSAAEHGVTLDVMDGKAEALPFPDGSFDAVVCSFTLCSVDDPPQVFREASRVLRPGGKMIMIEHIAAREGTGLRAVQNAVTPIQAGLIGCHLTRSTDALVQSTVRPSADGEAPLFSSMDLCRVIDRNAFVFFPETPVLLSVVTK